jgi:hypothetical protein
MNGANSVCSCIQPSAFTSPPENGFVSTDNTDFDVLGQFLCRGDLEGQLYWSI